MSMILSLFIMLISQVVELKSFMTEDLYNVVAKDQGPSREVDKVIRPKAPSIPKTNHNNKESVYDYNDLLNEYLMQTDEKAKSNTNNEGKLESGVIRLEKRDAALLRLWEIIKVWFIVYLIIAVPLWCTRGWCCCCLVCRFFKPRKTIDFAKKYLLLYPPGIFVINGKTIQYDPTEREKEYYEEFEHFIRTL